MNIPSTTQYRDASTANNPTVPGFADKLEQDTVHQLMQLEPITRHTVIGNILEALEREHILERQDLMSRIESHNERLNWYNNTSYLYIEKIEKPEKLAPLGMQILTPR